MWHELPDAEHRGLDILVIDTLSFFSHVMK